MRFFIYLVNIMAAANDKAFAGEQFRIGIAAVIQRHYVFGRFVVAVLQAFIAYGNEFAFIAGGAAAFSEPVYRSIPKYVLLPIHNALDVGLQVVVFMNRDGLLELFYGK